MLKVYSDIGQPLLLLLTFIMATGGQGATRHMLSLQDWDQFSRAVLYVECTQENKDIGVKTEHVYAMCKDNQGIEGILKLPQQVDRDEFLLVLHPEDSAELLSLRMQQLSGAVQVELDVSVGPVIIRRLCKSLGEIEHATPVLAKTFKGYIEQCLVHGAPTDTKAIWHVNSKYLIASTPHIDPPKHPSIGKLLAGLEGETDIDLLNMLQGLHLECMKRGVPVGPSVPIMPKANESLNMDELGNTIAGSNQKFLDDLSKKGFLRSKVPKLHTFSGDGSTKDISFELWEYKVNQLRDSGLHPESAIIEAITDSLKGRAAEALRYVGPRASLSQIMSALQGKYGVASSFDTLMGSYYTLCQEETEDVTQYANRIENKLSSIVHRFPERFHGNAEQQTLRDRFFKGLKPIYSSSLRHKFDNPDVPYCELFTAARGIEDEGKLHDSLSKKEKNKAKVANIVTKDENKEGTQNLSELAKIVKQVQEQVLVTQKALQGITESFKDYENRNNTFHVPYNQRGRGNHNNHEQNGRGRGYLGRGRGYQGRGNYQGNNQTQRGGYRGGFRGGQRNNQRGGNHQGNNQGNNPQGNNQHDGNQGNNQQGNQPNQGRRGPYCRFCANQGADDVAHWPQNCDFVTSVLEEWHQDQRENGHQNASGSLNG